jgi:hypothetical protein
MAFQHLFALSDERCGRLATTVIAEQIKHELIETKPLSLNLAVRSVWVQQIKSDGQDIFISLDGTGTHITEGEYYPLSADEMYFLYKCVQNRFTIVSELQINYAIESSPVYYDLNPGSQLEYLRCAVKFLDPFNACGKEELLTWMLDAIMVVRCISPVLERTARVQRIPEED